MCCSAKTIWSTKKKWEEPLSQAKPFKISKYDVYAAWCQVKSNRGTYGIDDISIGKFGENLKGNLYKLWNRLASGSYFPPAVKAVEIPKKDGKKRILGIPTVSDRIAQTLVRNHFEKSVEPMFHRDSYAYRQGKSAHAALEVTRRRCWQYDWVLEFDIKGAFDNIDHKLMLKAVCYHTDCRWTRLYIERWLKAPSLTKDGSLLAREKGTPQGGVISPLLFNLYLHYAFDHWMARYYRHVPFVRYADDGLLHCHSESEAVALRHAIGDRLRACGLELHPKKTKIVYCRDANRRGNYPVTQFEFLGFVFRGRLAKSRSGKYFNSFSPAISRSATLNIRKVMRGWRLSRWTNAEVEDIGRRINATVRGWWNYYGAFFPSVMKRVLSPLNEILVKWASRKYKRFKRRKAPARKWLRRLSERETSLLAIWDIGVRPAVEQ